MVKFFGQPRLLVAAIVLAGLGLFGFVSAQLSDLASRDHGAVSELVFDAASHDYLLKRTIFEVRAGKQGAATVLAALPQRLGILRERLAAIRQNIGDGDSETLTALAALDGILATQLDQVNALLVLSADPLTNGPEIQAVSTQILATSPDRIIRDLRAISSKTLKEEITLLHIDWLLLLSLTIIFVIAGGVTVYSRYRMALETEYAERRRAQSEAAEKDALLNVVFDSLPSLLTVRDLDGRMVLVNKALIGRSPKPEAEMLGLTSHALYGTDTSRTLDENVRIVARTGQPVLGHERTVSGNLTRWYTTDFFPVFDANGEVRNVVVLSHDISDRKKAEFAAWEQAELLRVTFNTVPVFLSIRDTQGRFVLVNDSLQEMAPTPSTDFIGKTSYEVYGTEASRRLDEKIAEVLRTGNPIYNFSRNTETLYGRWYVTDIIPAFGEDGNIKNVVVMTQDIAEKMRHEADAREKSAIIQAVFNNLPETILIRNARGEFVLVNEKYAQLLGKPVEEIIGKRSEDFLPPEWVERAQREEQMILETGAHVTEERVGLNDLLGNERVILATRFPVTLPNGETIGVGTTNVDITQLKTVQRELERHRDHLADIVADQTQELRDAHDEILKSERLAAVGRLTATVSHELRNPLGTIQASFDAIRMKLEKSGQAAPDTMARIDRSIARCTRIIDELLDFSRTRALSNSDVNIDEWCREIVREIVPPDGAALAMDLDADIDISMDRDRMQQVVENLIQNAWQAAMDYRPADAAVSLKTRVNGEGVEIRVTDNGPGVPPDLREKIFEPLFSTKVYGVGLGLPLVKQIVELHGGRIALADRSDGSEGAEFIVTLPHRNTAAGNEHFPISTAAT